MAAGMHFLVGVATDNYVLLASDKATFAYGAIVVSNDEHKEYRLNDKLSMMIAGEEGDVAQFGDWVKRNLKLYAIRNGYALSPRSTHHWIRRSIAESLRTQDHYTVDVVVGGYDDKEQRPYLGQVDYLGNSIGDQPFVFRGFCGRFCYAIADRDYKKDMTEAEGVELVRKCLAEAKKRFVANLSAWHVVIIDKNGHRVLENFNV